MNRKVRHKSDSGHSLFDYNSVASYDDCQDRIVCLSERSFNIILNALQYTDQMKTRVFINQNDDLYEIAGDEDWSNFQYWVSKIRTELGEYLMCNEILTEISASLASIAGNVASIDAKTPSLATCEEITSDLSDFLGPTHPVTEIFSFLCEHFPTLALRLDPGQVFGWLLDKEAKDLPLLAELSAMNASLGLIAAAQVGEAPLSAARTLLAAFSSIDNMWGRVHDYIVGDLSWFDVIRAIWNYFLPDGEGGSGGDDPDTNPDLRVAVNIVTNNPVTVENTFSPNISVSGSSGGGGCCTVDGSTDVTEVSGIPAPTVPTGEDTPPGFEDRPTYDTYRCKAIQFVVYEYAHTLINFGGLGAVVGGLTMAVITGLILTPLAPVALILLMAALSVLASVDLALLFHFTELGIGLQDGLEDMLCDLYNADDLETLRGLIEDNLNATIATWSLDTYLAEAFGSASDYLLSNELVTYIFSPSDSQKAEVEAWDNPYGLSCAGCTDIPADCLAVTDGFIDSIEAAGGYDGVLHMHTGGNAGDYGCTGGTTVIRIECPCDVTVHAESTDGYSSSTGCVTFYVYDVMDSHVQFSGNVWSDQSIPSGGGLYIFTDSESHWDIFFTND